MSDSTPLRLTGLVAATHTPFDDAGELRLAVVEQQAEHLLKNGVQTVFIGGSTGEAHSLTLDERRVLAERWLAVARGTALRVVVHVGSNCLPDARALASQAASLGAAAVSALAPSYFKPRTLDALVDWCAAIAGAAPGVPFYYYDIPSMTGVSFPMPEFLDRAAPRVPTLAGIKFTNPDLMGYLRCLRSGGGRFDVPWGIDEHLLAAVATGATGAVGSTYNFAAPIYQRLLAAFGRNDLAAARDEQLRAIELIALLNPFGYMAAARAVMEQLGVPVGPPRPPHARLSPADRHELGASLERMGFAGWVR
jgi:N-acetylneuraminate lyase